MQDGQKLYFAVNTGYLEQTIISFNLLSQETIPVLTKQSILYIGQHNNDYFYQEVIGAETHIRSILDRDFEYA